MMGINAIVVRFLVRHKKPHMMRLNTRRVYARLCYYYYYMFESREVALRLFRLCLYVR